MRRPKRAGIASWARRSRRSTLKLPRWRQAKTEQIPTLWKWLVRLIRMLCVLGGTALAGATFWYGYDGYLDNKCMTMMQEWSNMVDLLDYCDQEVSDSAARDITCATINRHALPAPPSCGSRGSTQAVASEPTVSPGFTSDLGAPRNVSRAVSTVLRSSKLAVSGWDSSALIGPAVTPTASLQSTTKDPVTPTTLIQSRTVVQTSLLGLPVTATPTVAISRLLPPTSTSAALTPMSHGEPYSSTRCSTAVSIGGPMTVIVDDGSGQRPLRAQPTPDLESWTLIRVTFARFLEFQSLVEQPTAMRQLYDLLPLLLSRHGSIPPSDIRVHEILPFRSADDNAPITAVAHVYCPTSELVNLRHVFWDPVSQLYHLRHEQFTSAATIFRELFDLFKLTGSRAAGRETVLVETTPGQPTHISGENAVAPARPLVPGDHRDDFLAATGADKNVLTGFVTSLVPSLGLAWSGTLVSALVVIVAYCFAMVIVAQRYKNRKRRALPLVELKS